MEATPWSALRKRRTPEEEALLELGIDPGANASPLMAPGPSPAADPLTDIVTQIRKAAGDPKKAAAEGLKTSMVVDSKAQEKKSTTTNSYPDPFGEDPNDEATKQYQRMRYLMDKDPDLMAQRQGQRKLEDLLVMQMQEPADYAGAVARPLAALTDSLTGSHLIQGVPQHKPKDVMGMAEKLQDNRRDITSKAFDAARSMRSGNVTDLLLKDIASRIIAGTDPGGKKKSGDMAPQKPEQAYDRVWTRFKDDRVAGKVLHQLQFVDNSVKLLENKNSISDEMLKRLMLNLVGDTRPSDRDVQAFGGDRRLMERVQQAYDLAISSGTFSTTNRKHLLDTIEAVAGSAKDRFKKLVKNAALAGKQSNRAFANTNPAELEKFLLTQAGYNDADLVSQPTRADKDEEKMKQFKQITDELRKLKSE